MKKFIVQGHGRYHLEFKFRYLIKRADSKFRDYFRIKFYFFFPYPFNIRPSTYDRTLFFEDQKLYLRFNTPVFRPKELLSDDNSPLKRTEALLEDIGEGYDKELFVDLVYESKLLGSVYKSLLRESLFTFRKKYKKLSIDQFISTSLVVFSEISASAEKFHSLCRNLNGMKPNQDEQLKTHMRVIDEYLSLELERTYLQCLKFSGHDPRLKKLYDFFEREIADEMEYRSSQGYPSVSSRDTGQAHLEEYVYRSKILKRYVSEVLFFLVRRKDQGKRIEQVMYALAAGVAMIVATGLAFIGQTRFGNLSYSLFLLLVISYMLKDRIKDLFRDIFSKSIGSFFYDRRIQIYDHRFNKKLARVKDKIYFSDENSIPESILKMRNRGSFERFLSTTASENILVYEKLIRLNSRSLARIHNRIHGIADISNINLRNMLRYLGVQKRIIPIITNGEIIEQIPVHRLYHLNVVVSYEGADSSFTQRIRLIVNGKGIQRIEEIEEVGSS